MITGLIIILGAVVGLICHFIKGSGYGLWWDIALGIFGSIISSVLMTYAYFMNGLGTEDILGLNPYSMIVAVVGALVFIYGIGLYQRANDGSIKFHKLN